MISKPWRPVTRPLTLTVKRRWAWGADPRTTKPTLISPRGHIFECRWRSEAGKWALFARPYQNYQLAAD